ncbi:hypothetical protein HMPREF1575_01118 [Gardnerella vaginalis JCP7672]|nr:hypothetical protein HMPREF1575_01118 [Gardnerella vaginalis JCP7672]
MFVVEQLQKTSASLKKKNKHYSSAGLAASAEVAINRRPLAKWSF